MLLITYVLPTQAKLRAISGGIRFSGFLVDTSIVNMYVMHLNRCRKTQDPQKPMMHLEFKTTLCAELLRDWQTERGPQNALV